MPDPSAAASAQQPQSPNVGLAEALLTVYQDAFARHQAGQFLEAVHRYNWILSFESGLADVQNNLGHALCALGRHEAALPAFQRSVDLKPDFPEAMCNWGLALAELDHYDEAEAKYRQAIRLDPRFSGAYNNLGLLLRERGRLQEAREAFEEAIALQPTNFAVYVNLAGIRQFAADDPHLATLETWARRSAEIAVADQIHLHFALSKTYDGLGRNEDSFRHLLRANALKRQQLGYDEAGTLGLMMRVREVMSRDFIAAHQGHGDPSEQPVFIVGMMRSGTTLIEQVLASHPQVHGAGELALLDQMAGMVRTLLPGCPMFPEMLPKMMPEHVRSLGGLYVRRLTQLAPAAHRLTDKMTMNFLFVGLIHLILPNARIIHAVRDPLDTCVSCFSTSFTRAQEHTYDLAELGRYYRHYRELMAHWHAVLPPGRILDVRYEDLVADLEGSARQIVSHCGLAWDARCLDFHSNKRAVRTASAAQVRKPIYGDSIGRWRKYQNFLGPLLAEIGPVAQITNAA